MPDRLDDLFRGHVALAILRILEGGVLRGAGNDHLLQVLLAELGLRLSRDGLRDVISLLERTGAVTSSSVRGLVVVELTRRGAEIAQGLELEEGIARAGPEGLY